MKEYFRIQFKMLNRQMTEFGLPPLVGYSVIPIIFFLLSYYLFLKTELASYLYIFLALSFITKLSEPKRNDFLKSIYNKKDYLKLRLLENLIYVSPFLLFLIYKALFFFGLTLVLLAIFIARFNFNIKPNTTIPTPFGKKPFEFLVGFRNTFYLFPIAYFLTYISISVENFNLGVFSLVSITLISFSYYSKPENEYFVWNYNLSPKQFLFEKIKAGLINFTVLVLPIILFTSIFFFQKMHIIIAFYLASLIYITTTILAKYSTYPNKIDLPKSILLTISLIMPPILLAIIPFFYFRSVKKLGLILK